MKEKGLFVFIVLCFVVMLAPFAGMLVAPTTETTENKELMELPVLKDENGININFLSQLGDYFQEHFAFRQELVSANAKIYGEVFDASTTDQVVIGDEDWMYYTGTLDDYLGDNVMSDRAIFNAVHNLKIMQNYVESKGGQFLLAIVPNKNSLYDENMPYYYEKTDDATNYDKLRVKMLEEGISFVDLHETFLGIDEVLYLKRDSHWRNTGAVVAYNAMMGAMTTGYETYENVPYETRVDYIGDLTEMLYPLNSEPEANEYYQKDWSWTYVNEVTDNMDEWIETQNSEADETLLMYRDSFGESLLPFFAESFENAYFSRLVPYNLANVDRYTPDYTIIEKVERRIPSFASELPILSAPTLKIKVDTVLESESTIEVSSEGGYYSVRGVVDANVMTDDSEIRVLFTNEQGKSVGYIPFYISGESDAENNDYGYGMYIEKRSIPADTYNVQLIIESKGQLVCVDSQKIDLRKYNEK